MSLEERAKATAKNVEGKIQDAVGRATGDPEDQIKGKAKQAEGSARHAKEDVKDDVKRGADKL
ncbi:MAG: CsbD family protein [Leptolyngbyaceae cyanobacterium RU_5_1]|nr:CsbD family protein [Leptolyngbyaceae cyanobacterium RU_5_1]